MSEIETLKEEIEALIVDVLYWREKCWNLRLQSEQPHRFWARRNSKNEEELKEDIEALNKDVLYCSSMWNREQEALSYKAEAYKYKELFTDEGWQQMCKNDKDLDRLAYWKSILEEAKEVTQNISLNKR
jgi:hypothetical protein